MRGACFRGKTSGHPRSCQLDPFTSLLLLLGRKDDGGKRNKSTKCKAAKIPIRCAFKKDLGVAEDAAGFLCCMFNYSHSYIHI